MKIRTVLVAFLFCVSIYFAYQTYGLEKTRISLKEDLIELSKIKYGLFNVDEWKIILADIITKKINEFNLEGSNRVEMRKKITEFLTVEISKLEERYYDEKSRSLIGILQGSVAVITGTFDKIKKDIPVFTEEILDFLNDEKNKEAIRIYLINRLNEYTDETFSKTDYSSLSRILVEYNKQDYANAKTHIQGQISEIDSRNDSYKLGLILIAITAILIVGVYGKLKNNELILMQLLSLIFLLIGVLLPMIEIDARIASLEFTILGEKVQFLDQVLYYKSKSILEVVQLMVQQGRIDLFSIGILVLTFSVLFPLSKMICSVLYLQNYSLRSNPIVSFLVLRSGKWSMADVMVIAIFMAYIGFDGIISEQLRQLTGLSQNLNALTTNKSNLLFGFYMFTLFVILSLFLSHRIHTNTKSVSSINTVS